MHNSLPPSTPFCKLSPYIRAFFLFIDSFENLFENLYKKNRCLDLRKQNLMFKSSSNKVNQPFYCEYAKIKNSPYSKTNQLYF